MKRIAYAGGSVDTGDAVADALLDYVTDVPQTASNITVEIPVRESDGEISTHTLILGPSTQLDVSDIEDAERVDEAKDFLVPNLAQVTEVAKSEPLEEDAQAARAFDKAVAQIDENLDNVGG